VGTGVGARRARGDDVCVQTQAIAAHAAATIFPGIDLDTLIFDPRPCPDDAPCTTY
jgi:hypothetical protein